MISCSASGLPLGESLGRSEKRKDLNFCKDFKFSQNRRFFTFLSRNELNRSRIQRARTVSATNRGNLSTQDAHAAVNRFEFNIRGYRRAPTPVLRMPRTRGQSSTRAKIPQNVRAFGANATNKGIGGALKGELSSISPGFQDVSRIWCCLRYRNPSIGVTTIQKWELKNIFRFMSRFFANG